MCKRGSRRRKCHGRGEIRESTRNQTSHMVRISLDFKFLRSKSKLPCDVNVVFLSNPNPDPWTLKAGMEEDGRFRVGGIGSQSQYRIRCGLEQRCRIRVVMKYCKHAGYRGV